MAIGDALKQATQRALASQQAARDAAAQLEQQRQETESGGSSEQSQPA